MDRKGLLPVESLELQLGLAVTQAPEPSDTRFEETAAKLIDDLEADADDLLRQPFMLHRIPVYPVHLVRPL